MKNVVCSWQDPGWHHLPPRGGKSLSWWGAMGENSFLAVTLEPVDRFQPNLVGIIPWGRDPKLLIRSVWAPWGPRRGALI